MPSSLAPDQAANADDPGTEANEAPPDANSAANSEEPLQLPSINHKEETEEDILNKIETEATDVADDNLDSHAEDSILNEDEEHQQATNGTKVVFKFDEDAFENNTNGEFKSFYEEDEAAIIKDELMEVDKLDIVDGVVKLEDKIKDEDVSMEDATAPTSNGIDNAQADKEEANTARAEQLAVVSMEDASAPTSNGIDNAQIDEEKPKNAPAEPLTVPLPIKEEPDSEETSSTENLSEDVQVKKEPDNADLDQTRPPSGEVFKAPIADKSMDDETELLDISMIRETEEDDACAIADAIAMEDKDAPRSDEDQNEKTETEQENSDGDGLAQDEDATNNGFVVMEEDSHMDGDDDNAITAETSKDNSDDSNEAKEVDENEEANKENVSVATAADASEQNKTDKIDEQDKEGDNVANDLVVDEDKNAEDKRKSKRTLSPDDEKTKPSAKKPKLVVEPKQKELPEKEPEPQVNGEASAEPSESEKAPKLQTLTSLANFMQCRKITKKLTRSDLEEICLQKICEVLVLKSSEGELHQTIRKQEQDLAALRKDVQQLNKQYKDLDIVHKKLLTELKTQRQNGNPKPLVPLKITRSVGLQVRLSPGNEANQTRRRSQANSVQQKTTPSPLGRPPAVSKVGQQQSNVVRQVLGTPQKPITKINNSAPMLSQALQKQRPKPILAKRATPSPAKKPTDAAKKPSPGVIDLTDEDDRKSATSGVKFRTVSSPNTRVVLNNNKAGGKSPLNQNKAAGKLNGLSSALPTGLRLAPASVISSTATSSSPQMLYVVPTITSNAGGQQKVAFVNFQPTNTMLSSTAVINKPGQSLTIKNVATTSTVSSASRPKHPAPLPVALRVNSDPKLKLTLPKPMLTIKKLDNGIILQWKMPYTLELYETIASYQLYAYQETTALPSTDMWRKVGDVKALALPMACTLTQFADKNKYYFAVRAVDVFQRIGAFSEPEEISL